MGFGIIGVAGKVSAQVTHRCANAKAWIVLIRWIAFTLSFQLTYSSVDVQREKHAKKGFAISTGGVFVDKSSLKSANGTRSNIAVYFSVSIKRVLDNRSPNYHMYTQQKCGVTKIDRRRISLRGALPHR
jgi:NAD-dependent oxidoreductase involved in siderophore biosynthesis